MLNFCLEHTGFGSFHHENHHWYKKTKQLAIERCKDNKDPTILESMQLQIHNALVLVHTSANEAIASILSTSINYDTEKNKEIQKDQEKRIIDYITEVFNNCDNSQIREAAKKSLIELLIHSNPNRQEEIFNIWIGICYHSNHIVAREYFLAMVHSLTSPASMDISYDLIALLNLTFFMIGDPHLNIRKSATDLLHWLSTRFFRTHQKTFQMHTSSQCSSKYLPQLVSEEKISFKISFKISLKYLLSLKGIF